MRATIIGSDPEIWRTLDVDESLSLAQLHFVLQAAFGWQNEHLHRFSEEDPYTPSRGIPRIGRRPRAWVDGWSLMERDIEGEEDEADATIGEAMQFDGPLWYEYDDGDGWIHRIDLIDRDAARVGEPPASIVAGERRGPLEDSGGVHGYQEKLAIIADPTHPEHEEITEWATWVAGPWGSIDPDDADLEGARGEVNSLFGEAAADMSGLVDAANGIGPDSPIAVLAAELPVPLRSNLRRRVHTTRLLDEIPLDEEAAAELVRPYAWLLERVGVDGMALTKAGWMPPAAVLEGMDHLGWREGWIGEANREELTRPMRRLRESAQRLRLVRKVNGRLELVARTRLIASDPVALADEIGRMLLRQRMTDDQALAGTLLVIGVADGSVHGPADAQRTVLDTLSAMGARDADGLTLDDRWFYGLTEPVRDVLHVLGLWNLWQDRFGPSPGLRLLARRALR